MKRDPREMSRGAWADEKMLDAEGPLDRENGIRLRSREGGFVFLNKMSVDDCRGVFHEVAKRPLWSFGSLSGEFSMGSLVLDVANFR